MLFIPDHDPTYRIISIDPGTNTMGVAQLDVDLVLGDVIVNEAVTFNGDRLSLSYPEVLDIHGGRIAKLLAHEENLLELFYLVQPHCVICESPFLGRFPQAFEALIECLTAIRRALFQYDRSLPLETVDPPTVKKAVGVVNKGSTKDDVNQAIRSLKGLSYNSGVDPALLDEHSTDAVAVGYYKYSQLMGE